MGLKWRIVLKNIEAIDLAFAENIQNLKEARLQMNQRLAADVDGHSGS